MIHFTKEGDRKKVGLNLYRTRGGFVVAWVWYYPATHELKCWRFRLRMHMKPRILWSVDSCNVIANYLTIHDLQFVNREVLVDLVASDNDGRMTKEEIIDMAREAGARQMVSSLTHPNGPVTALKFDLDSDSIKAFAKLVEAKEREACAKLCDLAMLQNQEAINELEKDEHVAQCFIQGAMTQLVKTSKAIRARGQE